MTTRTIKEELKKAFPDVKFSCKYEVQTWTVRVNWKWWPLTSEVTELASQFVPAEDIICNRENNFKQAETFMSNAGYTKESLLLWFEGLDDCDKIRAIASIVYGKTNNKEVWYIIANYVVS